MSECICALGFYDFRVYLDLPGDISMNLFRGAKDGTALADRKTNRDGGIRRIPRRFFPIAFMCIFTVAFFWLHAQCTAAAPTLATDPSAVLAAFRQVEVASVSDAIEQISGRRMYMSHHMQALFPTHFAGFAITVQLNKEENHDPNALNGMLAAIDNGKANSVYVMKIQDGADIAGMGGLMGTAMAARGFTGAVIDGGVRDVAYLRKIEFPVYATGIVPSTSVGHYRFAGSNIPIVCDGVMVHPGDIIVADNDGVVVVPRELAMRVLPLAQQLDFKEHSMYPYITKLKSIEQAVKRFGRL